MYKFIVSGIVRSPTIRRIYLTLECTTSALVTWASLPEDLEWTLDNEGHATSNGDYATYGGKTIKRFDLPPTDAWRVVNIGQTAKGQS